MPILPDFELIQHSFYGGHDITIVPIFDVHLGSQQCMEQEFISFIDWVKKTPNVYLVIGGDLCDNGTKSSLTSPFRAVMPPSQQKKEMANILKPVRDRCLVFVPGNHEKRSGKDADDDPILDIASMLDLEHLYRENIAFLKIQMGTAKSKSGDRANGLYRPTYTLCVVHGSGGGMLPGAALNRNTQFGNCIDNLDCLIVGHTHKPLMSQPSKLVIDTRNNIVTERPFKVVIATSWLRYGGYAASKMLLPASHCINTLTLRGNKKEMLVTM